jgi:hypothetical protein
MVLIFFFWFCKMLNLKTYISLCGMDSADVCLLNKSCITLSFLVFEMYAVIIFIKQHKKKLLVIINRSETSFGMFCCSCWTAPVRWCNHLVWKEKGDIFFGTKYAKLFISYQYIVLSFYVKHTKQKRRKKNCLLRAFWKLLASEYVDKFYGYFSKHFMSVNYTKSASFI